MHPLAEAHCLEKTKNTSLLSRNECEQILSKAIEDIPNVECAKLVDFHLEPAAADGFLGEYYYLYLDYASYDPKSVDQWGLKNSIAKTDRMKLFVKSLSKTSAEKEQKKIFKKEAELYATVFKELQKYLNAVCFAKCFYSSDSLIVLQNLDAMAGYRQLVGNSGDENIAESEMLSILKSLASLHAASLAFESKTKKKIDEHFPAELFEEITLKPDIAWFVVGLKALMAVAKSSKRYQDVGQQKFINEELETRLMGICNMQDTSEKYRNVVCHRDIWRANIFFASNKDQNNNNKHNECLIHKSGATEGCESESFKESPVPAAKPAVLVDFQTCRYCPPAIDLVFALFMNLSRAAREYNEQFYLQNYYGYLKSTLALHNLKAEAELSFEQLLSSYKEFRLFGITYKAISGTILKVPKEFVTNDYKYVNRCGQVLNYMRVNEDFRSFMENCLDEIMEYVFK